MEEYAEREEETMQAAQVETWVGDERAKVIPVEESRKRKIGDEQARVESSGENASDCVSDMTYVT